ncbi:MAG: undecaprenyl-diphosphatase UppP [Candidatus Marinimicrobia bacterium]|nr:undecaprenyl-diphosphatase UppP [Candidatus Neomarinimicrobiota bacterium]MBL7023468.1 undecaprenyl-diphosphatase UppP [Candidatus Neomarinimicrobiota bacterium]MBL7109277.1 undecaprenyl-diphosphatase UppP [Candidatus Neomarinimicrobiota bacterium]
MSWLDSLILGILQGISEFLPISSSGHLVLGKYFLGIQSPGAVLEVILHLGTLVAILIYYRKEILDLVLGIIRNQKSEKNYTITIVIATIPAVIVGLLFEEQIDSLFSDPFAHILASIALIATSVVLFSTKNIANKDSIKITFSIAFFIGLAQVVAIIPGISRSGMTIATGLFLGLASKDATKFSFMMAIPVLFGAGILKLDDALNLISAENIVPIFVGFVASAVVGYIVIAWLVSLVSRNKLWMFSIYCLLIGLAGILFT